MSSPDVGGYTVTIRPRTLWLAVALAAALVIGLIVLTRTIDALILLFTSIVLAEGIRPLVDRLSNGPIARPIVVLLLLLSVIVGFVLLGWLMIKPLVDQAISLVNDLPRYVHEAQRLIDHAQQLVNRNPQAASLLHGLSGQLQGMARQLLPLVLNLPFMLGGFFFKLLQILLFTFFWLTTTGHLKEFVLGLLPSSARPTAAATLTEMSHQLGGYLRGVIINMSVIGVLSGGGLWLLGIPYPVLLGLLAGLTEMLPFIGPWISGTPAVVLALITIGPLKAGEVVLLYMVIQIVEGNTLVPLVMNRTVHLNPLTITFGIVVGTSLLGLVGAVLAVPLTVIAQVLVVRVLAPLARRASARGTPEIVAAPVPMPPPEPPAAPVPGPTGVVRSRAGRPGGDAGESGTLSGSGTAARGGRNRKETESAG